jgi:hypothetical protein
MFEEIDKAIAVLSNRGSLWVSRRDAAESLGEAACGAVTALDAHQNDLDEDVRRVVRKGFDKVVACLGAATSASRTYSLEDLAHACEKPGERTVKPDGEGYVVEVKFKTGRRHYVYLMPFVQQDGARLIRMFAYCGKPTPESLRAALKDNLKLTHAALALCGEGKDERFMLVNCYLANEVSPAEVKASVREIAVYGDWLEEKLTGKDEF